MPRKQTQLILSGGKGPRQRIWEYIRVHRKRFTVTEVRKELSLATMTATSYLNALREGGYIKAIDQEPVIGGVSDRIVYKLVHDIGIEAPRVKPNGEPVTQGAKQQAMWGTIHRMFQAKDFSILELVALASTPTQPVSSELATSYVRALTKAGYLCNTVPAKRSRKPILGRYRLVQGKYTGPRAPIIARTKAVYDPNLNKVVYVDQEAIVNDL